mmetsp:Transcript_12633/g.23976  ORF Transcript_12633/g.23976 Transcript_12633/m.23976 type:complete len:289 (-) Transcript_12633:143-1009(-)
MTQASVPSGPIALLQHGDVQKPFGGCFPRESSSLVLRQGRRLMSQGAQHARNELLGVLVLQAVGEAGEELVLGVHGHHHPFAHRQRLRGGGGHHVREGGVDEAAVRAQVRVQMVLRAAEARVQLVPLRLGLYGCQVRPGSENVQVELLRLVLVVVVGQVQQLVEALAPHGFADEVRSLGEGAAPPARGQVSNLEKTLAHAVHKASHLLWQRLDGVAELDHLVAVQRHHQLVDVLEEPRVQFPAVLPGVLHVVGVRDSHHVRKGVRPQAPRVEPVEVLRLLQHRHVHKM